MDPKAIVRGYFEAYATGRPEAVVAWLDPEHAYHAPGGGPSLDRAGRLAEATAFLAAFVDVAVRIADQVAEGQTVATRLTMRARHAGPYLGVPATGRVVAFPFMDFAIVRDGKVLEEWSEFDMAAIGAQLE
jgi:steroid delta-isomerase-like uncharacterized protein